MPDARQVPDSPPLFVAIGASGGAGLDDVRALLAALPSPLAAVVLVVLHRPSDKVSHLREVLARVSPMPVLIADEDDRFHAGNCYIGEPAAHLTLAARSRVALVGGENDEYRNRTVDLLFASVAAHARQRGIGVVVSGALDDGSRGLAAIHHAGGVTMVLSSRGRADAGMPRNASAYDGPIDVMGDISGIAAEIAIRVGA